MLRSLLNLAFLALLCALQITATAQSSDPGIIPGHVLFMTTPDGDPYAIARDLRQLDGRNSDAHILKEVSAPMRIWELCFDHRAVPQQQMLDAVKRHPQVMLAQNDHPVTFRAVPNDPGYGNQWQHQNIDSEAAWNITTGGTTADGDDIVVCVIEAANVLHSDLVDNRWVNTAEIPNNGVDDDGNGYTDDYDGWNPGAGNDNNLYGGGHGTSVAGMIGARGNNGVGVAGANWNVKIMVVTVGSLTQSNVISSYTYPLVQRRRFNDSNGSQGAFVVATNASWGIDGANPNNYPLWCAIYDTLGTEGILNCGATANNNVNIDAVGDMPTACPSPFMVSVTATNSNDMRTFSGYGATTIDVGAPGENIYTTSGTSSGSNNYTYTSGTSFASPLTAGVIGLLYSAPCASLISLAKADPQAGALYVRQKLFEGVEQVGNLPGNTVTGGRINAYNSLQAVMADCGGCSAPSGLVAAEATPTSIHLNWNAGDGGPFNLRYRIQGAPQWTTVQNIAQASYTLIGLSACGAYEFQLQRDCGGGETSDHGPSTLFTLSGCCTPVTVEIVTDRYGQDITWSLTDGVTVWASGGPYTQMAGNGEYPRPSVEVCLPDGCYDLVVNDSFGDGICCQYGNGYVRVVDDNNMVLALVDDDVFGQVVEPFCVESQIQLDLKVWLQGPYVGPLMSDALRSNGLLPAQEPYTELQWPGGGGGELAQAGVFSVTGNNAIVDWIRVELRSPLDPTQVVAVRHGLLQRDGDVVDLDGVSPLAFSTAPGEYLVAVRHRNHLGCLTAAPLALSGSAVSLDLRSGAVATWGTDGRFANGSLRALWAGNTVGDGALKYTGANNDRDIILQQIGGTIPTSSISGYLITDVNLDGVVRYTGANNDRDPILQNVGGVVPTGTRTQQLP